MLKEALVLPVLFSDSLLFRSPAQPGDLDRLRALLREHEGACSALMFQLERLQQSCANAGLTEYPRAAAVCSPADAFSVFLQTRRQPGGGWENTLRAADLGAFNEQGLELDFDAVLLNHNQLTKWVDSDPQFLKAFRSAVFLACLSPGTPFVCHCGEKARALGEAVLADVYCHALPPQHRRFVRAAIGTGLSVLPENAFTIAVGGALPEPPENGVLADFSGEQPRLLLNMHSLGFAQRTVRTLLTRLDLPFLLSMWNAAEKTVVETMGAAYAAEAQDLVTWQMLRKNFASHKFSITAEEHKRLQRKVKEYQYLDT
jgi:hypothetical protein